MHGVKLKPPEKLKVLILPVEWDVKINKVTDLKTAKKGDKKDKSVLLEELEVIRSEIWLELYNQINQSYFFQPLSVMSSSIEVTSQREGEDLILRTRIYGYGKIKKKWQFLLLGSGFVEGVTQGFLSYKLLKNKSLAVLIACEEFLQEALTWVGGIYFFNRIFSPVIIKGELISPKDGKIIWSKTAFTTVDRKALKKYPPEDRKLKEIRLKSAYHKAIKKIISDMEKKALDNFYSPSSAVFVRK